jgi:putative membrane protein
MMHHGGDFGGWMWIMMAGGTIFLISVIAFAVWAVRRFTDRPRTSSARKILDQRFARGEIDAEEYSSRLRRLEAQQ